MLANTLTSLHVSFLEGWVQYLVAPVLLGEVFQGAAIRLHLLIQPTAVDQHRGTALGVPASLTKHLLQLLYSVAALPLADAMLFHAAVAAPQRLDVMGGWIKDLLSCCSSNRRLLFGQFYCMVTHRQDHKEERCHTVVATWDGYLQQV